MIDGNGLKENALLNNAVFNAFVIAVLNPQKFDILKFIKKIYRNESPRNVINKRIFVPSR